MPSHVFKIESGKLGLTLTDPAITDACSATLAQFTDFSCQITSGALTASPNVTTETVPATWCEPEQSTPNVGVTSYTLDAGYLQDPDVVDGLSRFLFEHDTERAWFFMGLDGDDPPKAVGVVRLVSGAIGGAGRTVLTATVSLALEAKPMICFGDATSSANVGGGVDPLDVSATYPAAAAAADLTTLQADAVSGDTGSGAPFNGGTGTDPAFSTGQYITLADASSAHWDGSGWLAGAA